jgi:photosystem II stability/assembly factor-like uncharacterized protein
MSHLSLVRWSYLTPLTVALLATSPSTQSPPVDPTLYAGLVWRNVGPFRAGRIAAVSGVVGQPGVFYVGLPAGGVWKTTSAGETWFPVFDSIKAVSSIGAIEVAPSDPNVIYAGTGDMATGGAVNEGNGVYKSVDAGKSWQHLGLDATKQIPSILVDTRDPNLVMIAGQGNVHQRSDTRGVFRSTDGGRTWTKTLYIDDQTGIQKLARAFDMPNVVFATTVRHYTPPGATPQRGAAPDTGRTGTALYKSTDEGVTWQEITGGGLPRLSGRTSLAVAMNTNAQRVFLISNTGLYRSDDGGTTWRQMDASDERIRNGQGGYNCGVYVDPKNPDIVYTINTSSYKSTDGGNTFTGFKGAPGGDDPQQMWIDPTNGQRILLGLDQGAVVSLDGGTTWSSWYNQSTEQVYHLAIDNSFPYWIYATQQDAGAVRTRARGNFGEVTPLDWNPVSGWEWGTIVPDPLDPKIVYASGSGIVKILYPSEQWINVSPARDPNLELRTAFSQPIIFTPWNQRELLAGFQYLMATTDGGLHWRKLSPDLGVPKGGEPTLAGRAADGNNTRAPLGGAIESISPSTVAAGTIWVGTNNGLIKLTRDEGKTWQDVSIPDLPNAGRALVSSVDASHNDAAEAYVAVDLHTTGDYAPYVYRTRDFGKTWTKIIGGLPTDEPAGSFARVVRADTKKAGLLFAGMETSMYVSFDDGDHWQSLMLNLPTTSFRDLAIKDNDLVVGTYGRGIWVLDEFTVLRQLTPQIAGEPAYLFKPADAIRVRRNVNADTPFPPEVPHALNPPDGAIIYYSLARTPARAVTLDVLDASGNLVRHMSSVPDAPVPEASHPPEPNFWLAPPTGLPTNSGTNRVNWDLRYDAPPAFSHSYEINANPGQTPPSPEGPLAPPGTYTIKLTVDGRSYTQPLTVHNDPRSTASAADLRAQHTLLMKIDDGLRRTWDGYRQATALRAAVNAAASASAPADVSAAVAAFTARLDSIAGTARPRFGGFRRGRETRQSFMSVSGEFVGQLNAQDNADFAPTAPMLAAYGNACADLGTVAAALKNASTSDLTALNAVLARGGIREIPAPAAIVVGPQCGDRGGGR